MCLWNNCQWNRSNRNFRAASSIILELNLKHVINVNRLAMTSRWQLTEHKNFFWWSIFLILLFRFDCAFMVSQIELHLSWNRKLMTSWNTPSFFVLDNIVLSIVSMSQRSFFAKFEELYNIELNLCHVSLRSGIIYWKFSRSSLSWIKYVLIKLAFQCWHTFWTATTMVDFDSLSFFLVQL